MVACDLGRLVLDRAGRTGYLLPTVRGLGFDSGEFGGKDAENVGSRILQLLQYSTVQQRGILR